MRPLLSIIIPTKNRYNYLELCLKSIADYFNRPEVEIIITDNSTTLKEIYSMSMFSNIIYSYAPIPISQVENFELALGKVTGEFVTMIGDDDGLSSMLLNVVEFMKSKNIEALNAPFVSYYWPDVVFKNVLNDFSGKMYHKNYNFKIKDINVENEIEKCLELGGGSLCNLPRMYYGIIRKDILDKVKEASGFFFPGPSPDMANAFSAAIFTKRAIVFDAPLFIAGNSAKSAAGMGLAGRHVGLIKGNKLLPIDCHISWSPLVPKFWSGPTIWAESLLKAAELTGNETLIKRFNFYRLYANCLTFHREYSNVIYESISANLGSQIKIVIHLKVMWIQFEILLTRFKFLCINILRKVVVTKNKSYSSIKDITEASIILKKYDISIMESLNKYGSN
jgi:glycosyltransferase involved in cell wall biosynthesis